MDGKIRVSIVATSLDGHKPESKTVLNMVNRIQNRNPGYSDNIFKNPNIENNTLNSIDGATALKLDEQLEIDAKPSSISNQTEIQGTAENDKITQDAGSYGISIENASYIENNLEIENKIDNLRTEKEFTPKLFSEDENHKVDEDNPQNNNLFDQSSSDDEEFEIPAFLRKQKF